MLAFIGRWAEGVLCWHVHRYPVLTALVTLRRLACSEQERDEIRFRPGADEEARSTRASSLPPIRADECGSKNLMRQRARWQGILLLGRWHMPVVRSSVRNEPGASISEVDHVDLRTDDQTVFVPAVFEVAVGQELAVVR